MGAKASAQMRVDARRSIPRSLLSVDSHPSADVTIERRLDLTLNPNSYDAHTLAELFNPDTQTWMVLDPTFDRCYHDCADKSDQSLGETVSAAALRLLIVARTPSASPICAAASRASHPYARAHRGQPKWLGSAKNPTL
jgi:hypothetical protein